MHSKVDTRKDSDHKPWSHDFAHVFKEELDAIGALPPDMASDVVQRAHNNQLTGLAFSGGGIRSATFNLGVLQGLAEMKLLKKFHYLSTVSGGGYIGSWLSAWLYRRDCNIDEVEKRLCPEWNHQPGHIEPREIRFLRQYSNYLTPKLGWFGADMWTAIATYMRNLLLNLIILVAMMVALLLVPRGAVWLASLLGTKGDWWWMFMVFMVLLGLSLLCSGLHIVRNLGFFTDEAVEPSVQKVQLQPVPPPVLPPFYRRQSGIQLLIVLPLFLAAFLMTVLMHYGHRELMSPSEQWFRALHWMLGAGAATVAIYGVSKLFLRLTCSTADTKNSASPDGDERTKRIFGTVWTDLWEKTRPTFLAALWLFVAAALGGAAFYGMKTFVTEQTILETRPLIWEAVDWGPSIWQAVTWGPPLVVGIMMLAATMLIGWMGRQFSDAMHEWWSRLGAWLLIYSLVWIGVFGIAFYSPPVLDWLAAVTISALSIGWIVSTIGGIIAAKSSGSGRRDSKPWVEMVASVAPYIFIIGLLAGLAWGIDAVLPPSKPDNNPTTTLLRSLTMRVELPAAVSAGEEKELPLSVKAASAETKQQRPLRDLISAHWRRMDSQNKEWAPLVVWLIAMGVAFLFSWRLDINRFSMHLLYRNRLARCYLGASNGPPRNPQPFTGFDPNDDIELAKLADICNKQRKTLRPYPIINTTLNLVGGSELAWQQRKGASFMFTPKYCGYEFPELPPGFCPTETYARLPRLNESACCPQPVTLATAMAISGAAASPNMGCHSSPAVTFLLTVFNVRLGWWLGNPRHATGWQRSSPTLVIGHLICEMFGLTDDKGSFIYLTDGGHFENLGLYELVRRRCRFIVACDAEQDPAFEFPGLGNAIEKCRADLGVDIEIDVEPIRHRNAAGYSRWHCAVGTIRYDRVDTDAPTGILVYIKASLTGDEPTDVLRYAAQHAEFPHQSTADQWFDESQFESYRALGHHAVTSVFGAVDALERLQGRTSERLFVDLRHRWYPPSEANGSFTKHTKRLATLYDKLCDLHFLHAQMYPAWQNLLPNGQQPHHDPAGKVLLPNGQQPPPRTNHPQPTDDERHKGFALCNAMIQLMEDVYLDLRLEQEQAHPDNRGWMNLFRLWALSPTFRLAWTISASTHGARFQSFCERHLGLGPDKVMVKKCALNIKNFVEKEEPVCQLNDLEQKLLRSFLQHHRTLWDEQAVKQPVLLQLTSEVTVPRDDKPLAFPFGFAVLHPKNDNGCNQEKRRIDDIVYFRVRDHLRNTGLGRRALIALIEKNDADGREVDIALKEMPYDAAEIPSDEDRAAFRQMFHAVKLEFEMKKREEEDAVASSMLVSPDK